MSTTEPTRKEKQQTPRIIVKMRTTANPHPAPTTNSPPYPYGELFGTRGDAVARAKSWLAGKLSNDLTWWGIYDYKTSSGVGQLILSGK